MAVPKVRHPEVLRETEGDGTMRRAILSSSPSLTSNATIPVWSSGAEKRPLVGRLGLALNFVMFGTESSVASLTMPIT